MGFYTWTYIDREDKQHHVGLYHGEKSGHVMIYIGKKVMTIDFSVFETKSYTFFLNDELCEIKLDRNDDRFVYTFNLDKKTSTPLNRARWALERKHLLQTALFFGGIALLVVLTIGGYQYFNNSSQQVIAQTLDTENAHEAIAKITIKDQSIDYYFTAQNEIIESRQKLPKSLLPLQTGDEFLVLYAPENPSINALQMDTIIAPQLQRFFQRTAAQQTATHPEQSPEYVRCFLELAYRLEGLDGLADIYFQEQLEENNKTHNNLSFKRLTRTGKFRKGIADCVVYE